MRSKNPQKLLAYSLLSAIGLSGALSAKPVSGARQRVATSSHTPESDALRQEIREWNAAVDARKAEKRARRALKETR
jgi:hypothetical protein